MSRPRPAAACSPTQHATVATKVALEAVHILVALAVVPILGRRLPTKG